MSHVNRLVRAIAAASIIVVLTAGAAAAGGYADVGFIDGMSEPPTAGEEREIRFSLLQHGVTPVNDGRVVLTATLPGAESVNFEATPLGDGEWVATVVIPSAGDWQLRVTHSEFETPVAAPMPVAAAAFSWPGSMLPIAAIALVAVLLVAGAGFMARRTSAEAVPSAGPAAR